MNLAKFDLLGMTFFLNDFKSIGIKFPWIEIDRIDLKKLILMVIFVFWMEYSSINLYIRQTGARVLGAPL